MNGSIRVSAKTVDDAITEALIQLGVTSDRLEYEVIEKGSAGFLGIGMKQAVIEARRKPEPKEEKVEEPVVEEPVKAMFLKGDLSFNEEVYITNARQKNALVNARESMKKVIFSIDAGMPEDFYSIDLMDAYESLGNITGESIGEDLVNEIFSKFCMGK